MINGWGPIEGLLFMIGIKRIWWVIGPVNDFKRANLGQHVNDIKKNKTRSTAVQCPWT